MIAIRARQANPENEEGLWLFSLNTFGKHYSPDTMDKFAHYLEEFAATIRNDMNYVRSVKANGAIYTPGGKIGNAGDVIPEPAWIIPE